MRPHVKDHLTGLFCLIDTGAAASIWPRKSFPKAKQDLRPRLKAVNGTPIASYGLKTIKLKLGPLHLQHRVVIADVAKPILGWDFLVAHNLDIVR